MSRRRGLGDCWSGTELVSSPHTHTHCYCACLGVWLWIWLCCGCGKGIFLCWCLTTAVSNTDYSSLLYVEWMNPSQDICRKLILSSIHHLGLVCDTSFTVYTRKLWALHILRSQDSSLRNAYGPESDCCTFLFWWSRCLWHFCYWATSLNIE